MKKRAFLLVFYVVLFFSFLFAINYEADIVLRINGIGIRHGTPNNLNLGTIQYSNDIQEVTGRFDSGFWVEDLMGLSTGHYTTIQCDGLYASTGSTITGIYFKAGNSFPYLIMGITGLVYVSNNLSEYKSILDPLVYIYKANHPSNLGLANKYGDMPYVKVVIPPYTTPGTYNGTIIFSLYTN